MMVKVMNMKKITKLTAVILALTLMFSFLVGCKKSVDGDYLSSTIIVYENGDSTGQNNEKDNGFGLGDLFGGSKENLLLYKKVKLENYIEVPEYKGIVVDTKSQEFLKYYNKIFEDDIEQKSLYKETNIIENGYIANIDFVGKIDGVAFDGGTGKEYNLKIGSNTFIDNFEEQLIGVKSGATKDVVVTFPSDYSEKTLAGKEAVFTVTVNYVGCPMTIEESYQKMGFESAEKYTSNITSRAIDEYLLNYVCSKAKIKDYPEDDKKVLGDAIYNHYAAIASASGTDFQQLLLGNGMTADQFKDQFSVEFMKTNMVMYYIFYAEGLKMIESTLQKQEVSEPAIAESYAVQEIAISYLYEKAEIK